jgi:glycosyltransferase involved in cell wall biosynthesis
MAKIAIIATSPFNPYWAQDDSVPIWIFNVANRLIKHNNVVVYSPRPDPFKKGVDYYNGIKYRRIFAPIDKWLWYLTYEIPKRIPGCLYASRKKPYSESILKDFTYILKVAKDLKSENCDIVHIHEASEFIDIIRALNPKIRIVLHMHCAKLWELDHNMIERRVKKADLILGCSQYITDNIQKNFPMLAERCHTLYNGVDLAMFGRSKDKKEKKLHHSNLLYVSKVTPEKGLHVLIEALEKIVKRNISIHLDVVGSFIPWPQSSIIWMSKDKKVQQLARFYDKKNGYSYLEQLKSKIASSNISKNVTFHGTIPHRDIVEYYQAADLFVLPSFCEAFGMGFVEAMAAQVPVIGTKVGGIPEILDNGEAGVLVESGNSKDLASAIIALIGNESLRQKMITRGKERVEEFTWDNAVRNLEFLYAHILNNSNLRNKPRTSFSENPQ